MPDAQAGESPADEGGYREQVLERFTTRAHSLVKQFTILLVFAFGFLVFIIVPLAALNFDSEHADAQQKQIDVLTERAKDLETERAALEEEVGILRGNITSLNFVLESRRQEAEARAGDRAVMEKRIAENGARTQQLEAQARTLEAAAAFIESAPTTFDAGQRVSDLRSWFGETAFGSNPDQACPSPDRRIRLTCLVKRKLETDWERDLSAIRARVVQPLEGAAPAIAGAIETELLAVRANFDERLAANQEFWRSVTGKGLFMDELSEDYVRAFDRIKTIVNQRLDEVAEQTTQIQANIGQLERAGKALEGRLAELEADLAGIEAETEAKFEDLSGKESAIEANEREQSRLTGEVARIREQLEALPDPEDIASQRADIEKRLSSFESPFGSIPIGLKEAVLAYPLILAAGFLVCALLLARVLRLRGEFRQSLEREDSLSATDVDRRVSVLTPLWFDPSRPLWLSPVLVGVFAIPFALFAATGWLILNDWLLQLGNTVSATNLRVFYAGLYASGLAVFLAGLVRIQGAWNLDRAELAAGAPAD